MKLIAATGRALRAQVPAATRAMSVRGMKIAIDTKDPSALPHDSPCAKDAGSYYDEIGGKQFVSARWDDRNPFATVEMFRHLHKPEYQAASPLRSIHQQGGGFSAAWDDRTPFYTAKLYQRIRPTRA